MTRLLRIASLLVCILCAENAFGVAPKGGACPSGANYINTSTGSLVTLSSLGVTSCFYASVAGADTNSGTTESSPWLHAPGMMGCTANCALIDNGSGNSGNAPPGVGIILRGGDVWHSSSLPWTWRSAGTSSKPDYLGVDKTWYSGSSWTRPILNMDGSSADGTNIMGAGYQTGGGDQAPFTQLDNIEFTGLYSCQSTGSGYSGYVQLNSPNDVFTNNYLHGWAHCSTPSVPDGCVLFGLNESIGQTGYIVEYNIWDGSDSTNGGDSCLAINEGGSDSTTVVAYNLIQYVANGMVAQLPIVHDNTILNIVRDYAQINGYGTYHGNAFENNHCQSPCFIYNNVIAGVNPNAGVTFWDSPNGSYDYIFNNVIVNTTNGNVVNTLTGNGAQAAGGYVMEFNNTVECGADSMPPASMCSGDTNSATAKSFFMNNHFLTKVPPVPLSNWGTQSNNVTQTKSTANGQGYSLTEMYSFSPTAASNSTARAGTNEQSLCATIAGLNSAAGMACQLDTTYGVSYNTSNHTVTSPGRTPVARPMTGAWDSGAYQFSSQVPSPVTAVKANVVQN
jgi:hypothetical protein